MADTTTKIVTLSTLSYYDGKIKEYIAAEDAKSLKTVVIDGNVLKFYRTEEPLSEDAVVAYEIELPEADLSNLLEKLNGTAGNVVTVAENGKDIVDSGVAVADLATKSEVETIAEKVATLEANGYDDTEVRELIQANADAIDVLNGTGEGSVAKQVSDAVAGIVNGAPEAYDTLKEISDWITAHPDSVAALNAAIAENATAIENLEKLVGTLPEDATATDIVGYIQELVAAEQAARKAADTALDDRLKVVEEASHTHANKDELDKIADGDVAKWNAAEQNAKDYVDSALAEEVTARNEAIATAKAEAISTASEDATAKANQALADAKEYADQAEADAVATASADATAKADAAEAAAIAKAEELNSAMATTVSGVQEDVSDHEDRIAALEAVETITTEDIDNLFA